MREPGKKGSAGRLVRKLQAVHGQERLWKEGLALPLSKGRVRGKEGGQSILCGSRTYSLVTS